MKKLKPMAKISMAVFLAIFFISCEKNTENPVSGNNNAMVEVMLAGQPSQYDAVNLDIQDVYLKNEMNEWVEVPLTAPGVYNLMDDSDILLGKAELPVAKVSQVKIVLGAENSVVANGIRHPLDLPSGSGGIILDLPDEVKDGTISRLWINFDIPGSIKDNGQDSYIFKPFFRLFSEASSGNLTGSVYPVKAMPVVKVFNESETMYTYPASNGKFMMRGVPAGVYTIEYSSGLVDSDYLKITKENVEISSGKTTELEPVVLNFLSKP